MITTDQADAWREAQPLEQWAVVVFVRETRVWRPTPMSNIRRGDIFRLMDDNTFVSPGGKPMPSHIAMYAGSDATRNFEGGVGWVVDCGIGDLEHLLRKTLN